MLSAIGLTVVILALVLARLTFVNRENPKRLAPEKRSLKASTKLIAIKLNHHEVRQKQEVQVTIDVTNRGGVSGTHKIRLSLDGKPVRAEEVAVEAGESKQVTYAVAANTAGIHTVRANSLKDTFTIKRANVLLTKLEVIPYEVRENDEVMVVASVINDGGVRGDIKLRFSLDGKVIDTREVVVEAGETELAYFHVIQYVAGEHIVRVNNLMSKFIIHESDIIITSLEVNPHAARENEMITVNVGLTNNGGVSGKHKLNLTLDGKTVKTREVNMAAGQSREITSTVSANRAGVHIVGIDGFQDKFVIPQAQIKLTALKVSPQQAKDNKPITATVSLVNEGGVTGTRKLELIRDGIPAGIKEVTIAPGQAESVTFELADSKAGEHTVRVETLEDKFFISVADIKLAEMYLVPEQAVENERVTVAAVVTNEGGITGNYDLELKIRGRFIAAQRVMIPPGTSQKFTFTLEDLRIGVHKVEIGPLSRELVVKDREGKVLNTKTV